MAVWIRLLIKLLKLSKSHIKMAAKMFRGPVVLNVAKRAYAHVAPAPADSKIQSTVNANKTFVAAVDNRSPITRVTIAFKAGSRYEPSTDLGLTHVLRSAAGLSTGSASGYILARKLAQIGATVSASGDREFIYYTLETTQEQIPAALELLTNLVSNQEFRPWELSDNNPRLKYDIVSLTPQVRAVDLLHRAAYRRGLGNSLYISPKKIGGISTESLQHFAANTLTSARCSVVVVGDSLERAKLVANTLELNGSGDIPATPSKYQGGDARKEMGGELVHLAVALQGAPASSPQSIAFAVAAKALGSGPVTKWGGTNSPLAKAVGNIGPFAAAGFNVSYSDSGLFGVVLSVPKDEASTALKAAVKSLKSPSLSSDAIKAGKNQLKTQILSDGDVGSALAESIAAQGLTSGSCKSPIDLAREVDQVTESQVNQALSNASQSKLAMGAVGNLSSVPFIDEL